MLLLLLLCVVVDTAEQERGVGCARLGYIRPQRQASLGEVCAGHAGRWPHMDGRGRTGVGVGVAMVDDNGWARGASVGKEYGGDSMGGCGRG